MKLTRAQFLKALPAAALVLAGCTAAPTAPADTDELVFDHAYPLDYATQFTADCYADGSTLLTIPDAQAKFLVRPEGAATLRTVPEGVTVLQQPVQNIYLVSTSAMDLFLHLDALDSIALSGTRAEGWYLDEAKQAMQAGRIAYAGKYSAPDYERILTAECGLAVENTMIYHTPEVKEQLERFGIPVLVERSSYESSPLARMEWIKLYGILLGKEALAEEVFAQQAQRIAPLLEQPSTGKRCAFFSITSSGLATVRKSGDYVAQMIGMAGGEYVFADLADSGNSLSTMNIPLEDLYAGVKDADVLIYNGTIEGSISTKEELLARCALLAECKAVQSGNIWCTTPSFFQQSMALADFMLDLHAVFTGEPADPDTLHFLTKITGGAAYDQPQTPYFFLLLPCPAAGGAVCREPVLGQRCAYPAGRACSPDQTRTGRAERRHYHTAAPAPRGDGRVAGRCALGSRLSVADLFCKPHCRPLCDGHFQRG